MNLTVKVASNSYEAIQNALLAEAKSFYGDRRFSFGRVDVKAADKSWYEAEASVFEVAERPTQANVPEEQWDPFRGSEGYAW